MQLGIFSVGSFRQLLILSLIFVSGAMHAADQTSDSNSETNGEIMGKVEYKLPDELGTLTFDLPSHWVGARADGVEALWIDQDATPFKDNVTLKIRAVTKVSDSEQLLDVYIDKLVNSLEATPVADVKKTAGHRSISFNNSVSGHELTQQVSVVYTESTEKSYLIILNHSLLSTGKPLDLSQAAIN